MLWRQPPQTLLIPQTAPVPDADALRRSALQASWQRDRRVARRRVLLRWLAWLGQRYLLPALLVIGLGAWLWLGVLPGMGNPLDHLVSAQKPTDRAAPTVLPAGGETVPVPASPLPPPSAEPEAAISHSPEGEELPVPLALRFDPRWGAAGQFAASASPAPDTFTPIQPHLKPENWLHSKEP